MNIINFLKNYLRSFSAKVFVSLVLTMVLVMGAMNIFFVRFEKARLAEHLREEGRILTHLLARNVRLGIFADDEAQLMNAVGAVLGQKNIDNVFVFDAAGELLKSGRRGKDGVGPATAADLGPKWHDKINKLQASPAYICEEQRDRFVFFAPVFAAPVFSGDSLYFAEESVSPVGTKVIGYVAVVVGKQEIARIYRSTVLNGTAMMLVFLLVSVVGTYFVIRAVTRPLSLLLTDIRSHGIQVKAKDELGMLHDTFASMIATVSQSFATIYDLKAGLEKKVAERTFELAERQRFLEKSNQRLEKSLRELRETQAQLIQSGKMAALGQLSVGIAHEINNTTNFISGALPSLKKRLAGLKIVLAGRDMAEAPNLLGDSGPVRNYKELLAGIDVLLANIEEGAYRTARIVKDLNCFSRLDDKVFRQTDLHEGLDNILRVLRHEYKNRIEIIKDYDHDLPRVFCLAGQINQVFMNILINALHAVSGTGNIRIVTRRVDGNVHVSIRDSGAGIPADILPRIFEPFFTTKDMGKGTGLGLGISYGIIQKHGGDIKVKSELGKGTEIEVIIPIDQSDKAVNQA